jgi:phosphate transport system substrate-binding protein
VGNNKPRTSLFRILIFLILGVAAAVVIYISPAWFIQGDNTPPAVHLKTGGTATVFLILENRWRVNYRKDKGMELDYASTGSTKGLTEMTDKDLSIAFTHAPMSEEQREQARSKGGEVVHIPVVLCAVAPVYNVKELQDKPPLKFSGDVLAGIFLGKIDKWNDPALKKLNEGVDLPETKITVVHREDSSGTTFIFSDYLCGASDAWREKYPKPSSEIKWQVGEGKPRNEGVARYVKETEGAIGYVDLVQAWINELPYGAVQNKDRTAFIHAEAKNMTAAAAAATVPEDLTFKLTNQPGADSYPITGTVWAVCYQTQPAANQKSVVDFLHWATHEGQQFAENMAYAPLPAAFIERVDKKLDSITAQ